MIYSVYNGDHVTHSCVQMSTHVCMAHANYCYLLQPVTQFLMKTRLIVWFYFPVNLAKWLHYPEKYSKNVMFAVKDKIMEQMDNFSTQKWPKH